MRRTVFAGLATLLLGAFANAQEVAEPFNVGTFEINGQPGFSVPEAIAETSTAPPIFQLFGLASADPFYAVIAQKREG